jgi:hypothetical protein
MKHIFFILQLKIKIIKINSIQNKNRISINWYRKYVLKYKNLLKRSKKKKKKKGSCVMSFFLLLFIIYTYNRIIFMWTILS